MHTDVSGATGSGKSTVLANIAGHLLETGRTVVAIDTDHDFAAQVFAAATAVDLPVLVLNASDPRSLQLEVLPAAGEVDDDALALARSRLSDGLTSLWPSEYTGPRWRAIADQTVELLAHIPGAHPLAHARDVLLADTLDVLRRSDVPQRLVQSLHHVVSASDDLVGWVVSKFATLDRRPAARRIIAPVGGGIRSEQAIDGYRAVIVNLGADAASREEVTMLGHVVLGALLDVAMSRAVDARFPVTFLVDEAHRYPDERLCRILTQGRKFSVSLVAAYQHLTQLSGALRTVRVTLGVGEVTRCFR